MPLARPRLKCLFAPVDVAMLVYFRMAVAITMLSWVLTTLLSGTIESLFIEPRIYFSYPGLGWIKPLPGNGMVIVFYVLGSAAIGVLVGLCYRLSAVVMALTFSYVFLLDKTTYQNHYYLLCLIAWLLVVVPANRAFAVDSAWRAAIRSDYVPRWSLDLLRFQIAIPYVYGGIAKLNGDWLQAQPIRTAFASRGSEPLIGPLVAHPAVPWIVAYGGLLFDLLIVPALLWRRTRPAAFALAVIFHLTNATLFQIGIFPWFMILATVLFFPASLPRDIAARRWSLRPVAVPKNLSQNRRERVPRPGNSVAEANLGIGSKGWNLQWGPPRILGVALLGLYVSLQLIIPLRHLAYAGNASWTEQGHCFAWHMMLRGKRTAIRYYATVPATGKTETVDLRQYLTQYQVARFGRDPLLVQQLAAVIADDYRRQGHPQVEVRALALVSLNGRKPQLLIDPRVDLAAVPPGGGALDWIIPLTEPLRREAWDAPLSEWERLVFSRPPRSGDKQ